MLTPKELRERGGHWIGAARSWMQRTFVNGDRVTWGSGEVLNGQVTVQKIEELAECVALAYANHDVPEIQSAEYSDLNMRLVLAFGWLAPNKFGKELIPIAKDEITRLRMALEEARVFATTVSQATGDDVSGVSPSTGVRWRSRKEWATDVAKQLGEILHRDAIEKSGRLPNLPPEANARGGA